MNMKRPLLGLTALIAGAIAVPVFAEEAKPQEEPKITYVDHVLPIFRARCTSCHNSSDQRGGLALDSYTQMMQGGSSGDVIEPGDAGNSYLFSLVTHASEPKMPLNGDKLPAAQLAIIEKWINQGALENASSKFVQKKKKGGLGNVVASMERPDDVAIPQRYFGEPVYQPRNANAVTALAASPWASLLAVSGHRQIGVYDSKNLHLLGVLPFPEGRAQIAKFSRNGSLLLVGGGRGGESGRVVLYDVRTGERVAELGEEYDEVLGADVSSNHALVALGGPDRLVRLYSVKTGELISEKKKHTDWITAVEFSPDAVLFATGDRANGLVVWESVSGEIFYDLTGHKGAITDISWRPDSNVVASASEDGTIKLWEMENGTLVKSWDAHPGGVTAIEFTRDGNIVSTGRDRVTRLWKGDGAKIRDFPAVADIAMEIAYDAESNRIFTGDWTGTITGWNAEDGSPVGALNTNPPTVKAQLDAARGQFDQLKKERDAQQARLQGLQKAIADRATAATAAAQKASEADSAVKQATAAKQALEEALKAKQKAVADAEGAVKKAQEQLAGLNAQLQKENEKAKGQQDQVNQLNQAVQAAAQAHQAAVAALADLTAKAETAEKNAQPTDEEKAALETDEAVRKAVEERQAAAKAARDAVKPASDLVATRQGELDGAKKKLAAAQAELDGVRKAVEAMQQQVNAAQQQLTGANTGLEAARKGVADAQNAIKDAAGKEQVAAKAAADAKAAAQKAAEAAKPNEEEQKGIAAAQAAIQSLDEKLKGVESNIARLEKIQSELADASKTASAN